MELYKELLIRALQDGHLTVSFQDFNPNELLESKCYQALCKIKAIIEDASLEDDACFNQIEQIIYTLEELGSNGGFRHDFG